MFRASLKPWVINKTVGSPLRSSKALVATVVPILIASISALGIVSLSVKPNNRRIPAKAASGYCSGFSESNLWVISEPSGFLATISVKVPPRSIQNCQRVLLWDCSFWDTSNVLINNLQIKFKQNSIL